MLFYEAALKGLTDLSLEDQKGLFLGMGSTYRWNARFSDSERTLKEAIKRFPESPEFSVFLSLTQLSLGQAELAVANLLELLLQESSSESIQQYRRALSEQVKLLRG